MYELKKGTSDGFDKIMENNTIHDKPHGENFISLYKGYTINLLTCLFVNEMSKNIDRDKLECYSISLLTEVVRDNSTKNELNFYIKRYEIEFTDHSVSELEFFTINLGVKVYIEEYIDMDEDEDSMKELTELISKECDEAFKKALALYNKNSHLFNVINITEVSKWDNLENFIFSVE